MSVPPLSRGLAVVLLSAMLTAISPSAALAQDATAHALNAAREAIELARRAGAERDAADDLVAARSWLAQAEKADDSARSLMGLVATPRMKKDREDEVVYLADMARLKALAAEARAKKAATLAQLASSQKTLADYQSAIALAKQRAEEAEKAKSVQAQTEAERQQLAAAQKRLADLEQQKKQEDALRRQQDALRQQQEERQRQEQEQQRREQERQREQQELQRRMQAERADAEKQKLAAMQDKLRALEKEREMVAAVGRIPGISSRVMSGKLILSIPVANLFSPGNELGPSGRKLLDAVGDFLKTHPDNKITVRGHTDITGSSSTNLELSEKRAQKVRDYLVNVQSLVADRISTQGMGAADPIATNATDAGRALNRRVDLEISLGQ